MLPDVTPTPDDKTHNIQIKNHNAKKRDAIEVFLGGDSSWKPGSLLNGHFILIGGSGAGKTETIRCIASDLDKQGYPVLMIDFHGDMACKNCNIRTYEMKEEGKYYFNPLELDPKFEEITPLRANSDFVNAIFINFPRLGIQQSGDLKEIIKKTYGEVGITKKKETWGRELDFKEIEEKIKDSKDKTTQTLKAYLNDIFDYELFSGSEKIAVGKILEGGVTHLNLRPLPEPLKFLFADLFLRKIYYSLQSLGEIPRGDITDRERFRLFVIVDEAKLLVSEKQGIKAVLNKYATELRKFGVGLILASQVITHFTDEILSNTAVKLCMKAENEVQARNNNKFFGAGENEIINLEQGEGILIIGKDKMKVKIVPTWVRKK
jgi:DNA helicase HerA-like ATPase